MTIMNKVKLPSGWQWVKFGDIIAASQPGFASGQRDSKGVIQLQMNNVDTRGNLIWDEFIRVPAEQMAIEKFSLKVGDVVFNNTNSTELVGKSALFNGYDEPVTYSNHFTRLRTKPDIADPGFITFWLISQWQAKTFANVCNRWIGQSAVKTDKLFALEIPLPPMDEQRRIASRLNEQLAAVESARKAAEEQLQAARQLPSAYLREFFDNHNANNWSKVRLGDILYLRKEVIHPYNKPKGPAVFVGLEHIESNTGIRIGSVDVEMSKLTGRKPKFYKGDIVYGYLRPYLNKVWIAEFDGLCSVDQYIYKVDDKKANTNFVAWFMRSPVYLERAPIDTTPGQLPRIRTEEVASVEINLPSLEEQKRISLQISEKLGGAKNIVDTLESQLAEINHLPASLLREAFVGQG
jgi:restriction endonuclease S subunit